MVTLVYVRFVTSTGRSSVRLVWRNFFITCVLCIISVLQAFKNADYEYNSFLIAITEQSPSGDSRYDILVIVAMIF
jgi:hypothetical protein